MNRDNTYLEVEESNFNRSPQNNMLNLKEEVEKEELNEKNKKSKDGERDEDELIETVIKEDHNNTINELKKNDENVLSNVDLNLSLNDKANKIKE